ncbi:hypothetical protein E2C01_051280 [Portunus trituberculatus]|uniref:Uncharacterized protein n=1 Tax=Portunus trituberculatus TaxID=210409 RepID=A0A5B7GIN7_PORTR|nr:hypothetical protein [Portunus trituberculatus]
MLHCFGQVVALFSFIQEDISQFLLYSTQPLSIKQPHDPHERDYQHIHFVPSLNSLALQGEAQGHPRTTTTTTTITTTATTTTTRL